MAASNYLMKSLIDHTLNNDVYSQPTELHLALFLDGAAEEDLRNNLLTNEVDEGNYQRVDITNYFDPVDVEDVRVTFNQTVTFTNMPAVVIRFAAILDQDSNVLFFGMSSDPIYTIENETFEIDPEDWELTSI